MLSLSVQVENETGADVYIIAMADLNGDGVMGADEIVQFAIPSDGLTEVLPLSFDNAISAPTGTDIPIQVMLSADGNIDNATPLNGEVEEFTLEVRAPTTVSLTEINSTAEPIVLLLTILFTVGTVGMIYGRRTN